MISTEIQIACAEEERLRLLLAKCFDLLTEFVVPIRTTRFAPNFKRLPD
jgi:hypothetical protein